MDRRSFVASIAAPAAPQLAASQPSAASLRCDPEGRFRLLMVSDLHYNALRDPDGIALTERLIDIEKPQFVIVAGDCISGKDCRTEAELRAAVGHVAEAMERKRVPWAIVFGNHDQEHFPKTGLSKEAVLDMYSAHPHNRNAGYQTGLHGAGNKHMLVYDSAGAKPVYCLWLIDSGDYFTDGKEHPYDWIRGDQVEWYRRTSLDLERTHGAAVPGLMFFHIPLREFNEMANRVKIVGARHEPECPSPVNSGLFAAVIDRGDVRGVYCGHDHVNNYLGRWKGVELGYDGIAGHRAYPRLDPADPANDHVRGGRVFEISAGPPARHTTWMRFKSGARGWESDAPSYLRDNLKA